MEAQTARKEGMMFMKTNNLIDLDQLSHAEVQELITLAGEIRKNPAWYMDACQIGRAHV